MSEVLLDVVVPAHVSDARRAVGHLLAAQGVPDGVAGDACLAVSEVVTNALLHGEPPVRFRAAASASLLRVEVSDGSPDQGAPQPASATASSGRGLAIVEAVVQRWGVQARGRGKTLWLEVDLRPPDDEGEAEGTVRLLGVPPALYIEAQEQLQGAMHELVLLSFEGESVLDPSVAAAIDRLRKAMHVFQSARSDGRAATEAARSAGADSVDLTWRLPRSAAPASTDWGIGVAAVERLADEGLLLTPPPEQAIRRLRQWIAREVTRQLAEGSEPEPFE